MKRRPSYVFALVLLIFLIMYGNSASAQQQLLYAAGGGGGGLSELMILDSNTGEVVDIIGSINFSITGMAFTADGLLFGVTGGLDPSHPGSLVMIDKSTGAGSLVGKLARPVFDITFNPQGALYGWAESVEDLFWINPSTALCTVVGDSGLANTQGGGLAISPTGIMYLTPDLDNGLLYTINQKNGLPVNSVSLNGVNGWEITGLDVNDAGVLYGVRKHNPPGSGPSTESGLITIDAATGIINPIGTITNGGVPVANLEAIAFSPSVFDARTGFWVAANENGQGSGVFIQIQNNTMALGWGAFTPDGSATYVFAECLRVGVSESFAGDLLRFENGPTFTGAPSPMVSQKKAGSITVTFSDGINGTITGTLDGDGFTKTINKTFGN